MYSEIDYRQLKKKTAETISKAVPNPIRIGLVFTMFGAVVNMLSSLTIYQNLTDSLLTKYMEAYQNLNLEACMYYLQQAAPPTSAIWIYLILRFALAMVGVGYGIFLLNTARENEPVIGNLLDGFGHLFRLISLVLVKLVVIGIPMLALVVPGIVISYNYRLAFYLLLEHPEMSVIECMRTSRELMKGHKRELFRLDLSFIGWLIAFTLPYLGIISSFLGVPLIGMANVLFYKEVCAQNDLQPAA